MASLDKLEGEAIETGVLIALIVFLVFFFGLYKTLGSPLQAAKQAWSKLLNWLLSAFQNIKAGLNTPVSQLGGSTAVGSVSTGSDLGWTQAKEDDYQAALLDALNQGQMTIAEYEQFSGGGN